MIEQELLFDLEKSFKDKFKDVQVISLGSAYLFDTPLFRLHLGNDLDVNDSDYWEYCNKRNNFLNVKTYVTCDRAFLNIYFLSDKTIKRAKLLIEKFNMIDPKTSTLVIPFTIGCDPMTSGSYSIVSFMVCE
jgi:hypothetical protein